MPLLYESTDAVIRYHRAKLKFSPGSSLTTYLVVFVAGALTGGILVYGPTRGAVIAAVAKGARVPAEKVQAWAKA